MAELNGNGNGQRSKQWQMLAAVGSLCISLLTLGKTVFFAGGSEARMEEHLRFNDARLDRLEAECAKSREIDIQIQSIKESQHRLEQTLDRVSIQLDTDPKRRH